MGHDPPRVLPGYRALFYGPPGTGKTITAALLGKDTGKEAFRINVSRVLSKYLGETEKNLSRLLDQAEHREWILLFDEADDLFACRSEVRNPPDRRAIEEAAYLLQRIEHYRGMAIVATRQGVPTDEAFLRRVQAVIHFPIPCPDERCLLWRRALPKQLEIAADIDWPVVAARYELTGGSIGNVIRSCAVEALADSSRALDLRRLEAAILRERANQSRQAHTGT